MTQRAEGEVASMPTVSLRFPGGRYHATPWGYHVNEGLIEWPPSPWRLLRAIIACGFSTQGWDQVPAEANVLIETLASVFPSYRVPAASVAHSRHYMPVGALDKGLEKTTLVFDTWANVGDGLLRIHWPCVLDTGEIGLLRDLISNLGYLGRSESWVEAELTSDDRGEWNATPCIDGERRGRGWEQVSLMAPLRPIEFDAWRGDQVDSALSLLPLPEGKKKISAKLRDAREKAEAPFPADLLSCLTKDTAWWKAFGWSQPPGSQRVLYWRHSDALEVGVPTKPKVGSSSPVTTMLLAITTASGNLAALPPVSRTLPQAELFHRAIVGRLGEGHRVNCPELTGKDLNDKPLQNHHRHAHTLPLDLDGDGHIDHILIHAAMGLRDSAQLAIRGLRRTWGKGKAGDLQLAVVGSGSAATFIGLNGKWGQAYEKLVALPEGTLAWRSRTPLVLPRFLKLRGKNSLLGQVNSELASRNLPLASAVAIDVELTKKLRHFVRRRKHGGSDPPLDQGYGVRITFSEPVSGPLVLGYGSHFGLGLFERADNSTPAM